MAQDDRDILDILRFELSFLQDGGYGRSPRSPWRAPAIFEDSPSCPNFCDPSHAVPCESCRLEQFVPEGQRKESVPCRFIQLTKEGQTVENLYRTASQGEMEAALADWLRAQIARIEQERGLAAKEGAA
ncbi:MAG TPA: hypothetical protein VMD76_05045 [Candidatus Sulfotelmatobacter sp.]|jgi:hypothetical protein|nr:hypothetical protein [Candidatus Sulfotelmatobacter sp.]